MWVKLKDLKESYPIKIMEYVKHKKLENEPAFAWWILYMNKKKKRIVKKIKSKYWERTHKYGIEIPKNIDEARAIDIKNRNRLWRDAIKEEMKHIREKAVREHEGSEQELLDLNYDKIGGHLIFDVKLGENFLRKAR